MATKKPSTKSQPKKTLVKTPKAKPVKKPTESQSEFESAWKEYNTALRVWKESLADWQRATNEALVAYHNACQRAQDSDTELLKKVSSSWESTWDEIGPEYIKQQTRMIENIFKETNIQSIKKFNEQWDKFLRISGDDSIKAYQEAIKRFNQAWHSNNM